MDAESKSAYNFARLHSEEIQLKYPFLFNNWPIGIKQLNLIAKYFGITLTRDLTGKMHGHLEVNENSAILRLNPSLPRNYLLLTIFHELAHWYLFKEHPELDFEKSLKWKEYYANAFASQICVPFSSRDEIISNFNQSESLSTVLYYNKFNLPISSFFNFVFSEGNYFQTLNTKNIWIVIKWTPNKFTKKDFKWRIISAIYSTKKYFIPINQGINGLYKIENELNNLTFATERFFKKEINLLERVELSHIKYNKSRFMADCSAVYLKDNSAKNDKQIILFFKINDKII